MRFFLQNFGINLPDRDIDFLNLNLDQDTKQFVDPFSVSMSGNKYCHEAHKSIRAFMELLILELKEISEKGKSVQAALTLFKHFSEPKGTGVGLSQKSYKGRGAGELRSDIILNALMDSEAVQSGAIEDLEELVLVVKGIGSDTISDITINLCLKSFAEYTYDQCQKLGIPTKKTKEKLFYFCFISKEWKSDFFELPHAEIGEDKKESHIILLPKEILEDKCAYDVSYYFTNIATPMFEQAIYASGAGASFIRATKNGPKINRTEMRRNEEYKGGKTRMSRFAAKNPQTLKEYRDRVAKYRYKKSQDRKKGNDDEKN